jgi:tetratricopeptide (TPR) repeat protein
MIALCHREQGDLDEAIIWYRKALEREGGSAEDLKGLRYDMAEALLLAGERQGALELFREVHEADPAYRDVRNRLTEIDRPETS